MKIKLSLLIAIATALILSACFTDSNEDETDTTPKVKVSANFFQDSVMNILGGVCIGCHGGGNPHINYNIPDLSATITDTVMAKKAGLDSVYNRLVNHKTNSDSGKIAPYVYVKPLFPDSSYLYHKLTKPSDSLKNNTMSMSGYVDSTQLDIIKRWILAGAPRK